MHPFTFTECTVKKCQRANVVPLSLGIAGLENVNVISRISTLLHNAHYKVFSGMCTGTLLQCWERLSLKQTICWTALLW